MKRVLFCLPEALLTAIDREAQANYITRSDLMRRALIFYLQPTRAARHQEATDDDKDADPLYVDPKELLEILQQQKLRASVKAMLRNAKRQRARRNSSK